MDEPKININPLSLVTPGIFRRIFEGKMPNAAQAPSNQAPAAPPPPQTPGRRFTSTCFFLPLDSFSTPRCQSASIDLQSDRSPPRR